jgi:hypothetical protein
MMQASECDEHCNWNEKEVFYGTAQVNGCCGVRASDVRSCALFEKASKCDVRCNWHDKQSFAALHWSDKH